MSTMMTFEYLSQLCQNKEQVFSLPAEAKDLKGDGTQLKTIFYKCSGTVCSSHLNGTVVIPNPF